MQPLPKIALTTSDYPRLEQLTYWTNWGASQNTLQLVWPEECSSVPARISVLSPLGAALIGLKVGEEMPTSWAGCLNLVPSPKREPVGKPA